MGWPPRSPSTMAWGDDEERGYRVPETPPPPAGMIIPRFSAGEWEYCPACGGYWVISTHAHAFWSIEDMPPLEPRMRREHCERCTGNFYFDEYTSIESFWGIQHRSGGDTFYFVGWYRFWDDQQFRWYSFLPGILGQTHYVTVNGAPARFHPEEWAAQYPPPRHNASMGRAQFLYDSYWENPLPLPSTNQAAPLAPSTSSRLTAKPWTPPVEALTSIPPCLSLAPDYDVCMPPCIGLTSHHIPAYHVELVEGIPHLNANANLGMEGPSPPLPRPRSIGGWD